MGFLLTDLRDVDRTSLEKLQRKLNLKLIEEVKKKEEQKARKKFAAVTKELLEDALDKRGITIGSTNFDFLQYSGGKTVTLDEKGVLHWPVLFFYPLVMESDVIQEFNEHDTLKDHLTNMFPPLQDYATWDKEKKYRADNLQIYYLINKTDRLKWIKKQKTGKQQSGEEKDKVEMITSEDPNIRVYLKPSSTLLRALTMHGYVVPGIPTFYVTPIS